MQPTTADRSSTNRYSPWFVIVPEVFVTCLITANIMAVKLVEVLGLVLPAAVIIFPISYIVGDILTDVYGYRQAQRVIWLGFFCNLIAVAAIWVAAILPPAAFWNGQATYERILVKLKIATRAAHCGPEPSARPW